MATIGRRSRGGEPVLRVRCTMIGSALHYRTGITVVRVNTPAFVIAFPIRRGLSIWIEPGRTTRVAPATDGRRRCPETIVFGQVRWAGDVRFLFTP